MLHLRRNGRFEFDVAKSDFLQLTAFGRFC